MPPQSGIGAGDSLDAQGIPANTEVHLPTSPSYAGPYVPYAVSDPDEAAWRGWYTLKKGRYADGRANVRDALNDKDGKYKGGGYDVEEFWEMEIRAAVQSLGIEPLT